MNKTLFLAIIFLVCIFSLTSIQYLTHGDRGDRNNLLKLTSINNENLKGLLSEIPPKYHKYMTNEAFEGIMTGEDFAFNEKVIDRRFNLLSFPLKYEVDRQTQYFAFDRAIGKIISKDKTRTIFASTFDELIIDFSLRALLIITIVMVTFANNENKTIEDKDNKLLLFYLGTMVAIAATSVFPAILSDFFTSQIMHVFAAFIGVLGGLLFCSFVGIFLGKLAGEKIGSMFATPGLLLPLFITGLYSGLNGLYLPFAFTNILTTVIACGAAYLFKIKILKKYDKNPTKDCLELN